VLLAALLLIVLSNGPVLLLTKGILDRPGLWSDWAIWPFFAAAAACGVPLVWSVWGDRPKGDLRRSLSPVALVAIGLYSAVAVASTLWSVDASATAWRSVTYSGLALLAIALAGFTRRELATTVLLFSGIVVATSVAVIVLRPSVGIDTNGHWEGVFTNRNSPAPVAAIAVIAGLRAFVSSGLTVASSESTGRRAPKRVGMVWQRCVAGVFVVVSLAVMAGAGSRTAWLALIAGLVGASVIAVVRQRQALASLAGVKQSRPGLWYLLVVAPAAMVALAAAWALTSLWDAPTFAQRREIWTLSWDWVSERPLRGYGFFTFWEQPEIATANELLSRGSAHNSFVEVMLGLGLLGAIPFVAVAVLAGVNSLRGLWRDPGPDTWLWAAVIVLVLVENTTESFVLWFSYNWVLVMTAALRKPQAHRANLASERVHR